jgi:hypothetical protein
LRTDKDELFVFDHVEARVIKRDHEHVTLRITNPTKYDARVAILTENAVQARRPVGNAAFLKWPKVEVKSGQSAEVILP